MPLPVGLREEHLCLIWEQGLLDPERLTTGDGSRLQVVYPGRRCGDPGPDFRDAVLALPGATLLHGDVEVHADRAGWLAHGHAGDPAYDRVILHVTWLGGEVVTTSSGRTVLSVALAPCLTISIDELRRLPTRPRLPIGPTCPARVPGHLLPSLPAFLSRQGLARLEVRAAVLGADVVAMGADQAIWTALLSALGYRRNTAPFARLSRVVPWPVASAMATRPGGTDRLLALMLGAAGFLSPTVRSLPLPDEQQRATWQALWSQLRPFCASTPLARPDWTVAGVRPDNAPPRRVAAAAALAVAYAEGLAEMLCAAVVQRGPVLRALPEDDFWRRHADFGRPVGPGAAALVGQSRQTEIAINAVLPAALALARMRADRDLERAVLERYGALTSSGGNQLTRHMARTIGAPAKAAGTAAAEQGLLHLYHSWCRERRCWECPLPAEFGSPTLDTPGPVVAKEAT